MHLTPIAVRFFCSMCFFLSVTLYVSQIGRCANRFVGCRYRCGVLVNNGVLKQIASLPQPTGLVKVIVRFRFLFGISLDSSN